MAGIPIYADRGPGGGYQLVDGYRTRLTGLTGDEAEVLALSGLPGPAAELGLGSVLATAELKLAAALPPEQRERSARTRERFHLDAPGWFTDPDAEPLPFLGAVADAVWEQRVLQVHYRSWRGEVDRRIEPLGLVLKAGTWYVVGLVGGEDRTYRVSRMLEVELLDEHFDWPEGFDLATYWAAYSARFEASIIQGECTVRLSPIAWERIQHWWSPRAVASMRGSAGEPDEQGWRRVVVPIESLNHARTELLRLGGEVEVLDPPALREMLLDSVRSLTNVYANDL
jgi:predicted DNA-binding transcriptional regulator YafY